MTSRSDNETPEQTWLRQYERIKKLRAQLDTHHQGQGEKWIIKMRDYYDRRLRLMDNARPASLKATVDVGEGGN